MIPRVDFSALARPVRFGQSAAGAKDQPGSEALTQTARAGLLAKVHSRRMAALKAANDILTAIPQEGESFHGILVTLVDLAHVLTALLERLGTVCQDMKIATLSLSARNVQEMAGWLDGGKVLKLDVLVSHFFSKNNEAIFHELLAEFHKRGQRVGVARSHAKIVTMEMSDGRKFVVESSANLRSNRNLETLCLACDRQLCDWFAAWVTEMVTNHAVQATTNDASRTPAAG